MRSFARDFSSSRRAPPNAASKPYWSSACFSASSSSRRCAPRAAVERVDAARDALRVQVHEQVEAVLVAPSVAERVHLPELPRRVDVQQRERRLRGRERLAARCSITELSLPIEYSITGLSASATTSRMMWMLSASSRSRWVRRTRSALMPAPPQAGRVPRASRRPGAPISSGSCSVVSIRSSGFTGSSYGSETPVNSEISPAIAFRRGPSRPAPAHSRPRARRRPRRMRRLLHELARACGASPRTARSPPTITAPPLRVSREATQPIRSMFVSRSSFEKPSPFERCVRTSSPSSHSTSEPAARRARGRRAARSSSCPRPRAR